MTERIHDVTRVRFGSGINYLFYLVQNTQEKHRVAPTPLEILEDTLHRPALEPSAEFIRKAIDRYNDVVQQELGFDGWSRHGCWSLPVEVSELVAQELRQIHLDRFPGSTP